jgi:hypothetical protein
MRMDDPVTRVRRAIRRRLNELSAQAEASLAAFVTAPPQPRWDVFDFEVCPYFYGVSDTEGEAILSDDQVEAVVYSDEVFEEAGVADEEFNYNEVLAEEFMNWLADCWERAGGLNLPHRSEAFFHGYHQHRFDFRTRAWYRLKGASTDQG